MEKIQLTITEEHLDTAISLRGNGDICADCVVSVAAKEKLPGFHTSAFGVLNFDNYTRATVPNKKLASIMDLFDCGYYDEVKELLPVTFELEKYDSRN